MPKQKKPLPEKKPFKVKIHREMMQEFEVVVQATDEEDAKCQADSLLDDGEDLLDKTNEEVTEFELEAEPAPLKVTDFTLRMKGHTAAFEASDTTAALARVLAQGVRSKKVAKQDRKAIERLLSRLDDVKFEQKEIEVNA